ncbi:MAG: tyrosine-type recombinase/integrase [Chloroflexi bacterium]|nr:tyrosine-type recombinase/integrase [Chloroflexota bacterium]MBV9597486.1 tyrosine-type recombinase/integrase [Chloroflexota bacterium]
MTAPVTPLVSAATIDLERHATAEEYGAFVRGLPRGTAYKRQLLLCRKFFVEAYPDLTGWKIAPLAERVGIRSSELAEPDDKHPAVRARMYLVFLCIEGYMRMDWGWALATKKLELGLFLRDAGVDLQIEHLLGIAYRLGYVGPSKQEQNLRWILNRIVLTAPVRQAMDITDDHLEQAAAAVWRFGQRPDIDVFFGSLEHYRARAHAFTSSITFLHNLLYHAGWVSRPSRPLVWPNKRTPVKPRMEAILFRYLRERGTTAETQTLRGLDFAMRHLIPWVAIRHPTIEAFAELTREHILEFARWLDDRQGILTKRPLTINTKIRILSGVGAFFRDVALWGWDDVPPRPLLTNGDLPKLPKRVPRFIPDDELGRLMQAVERLDDPFKRAALLVARWTGARRDEIQRLSVDCLDRYPDGTARLHLPVGKTYTERLVPIKEEAAEAIRVLQNLHRGGRGLPDRKTRLETHYLFMRKGKLLGRQYLFEDSLRAACTAAGLVGTQGSPTITAHRFRHTVGTKMAERGARLSSIMAMLGHHSPDMAMIYIAISDDEVRRDYEKMLQRGAIIAGPVATALGAGTLSAQTIDWMKTNFFKTSLELGHCLRLPEEGPCECDLYLTCAKFLTAPEYAPRLRRRRTLELELATDAACRGWNREVERHTATARKIEDLLDQLHEPVAGPVATD